MTAPVNTSWRIVWNAELYPFYTTLMRQLILIQS